MSTPATLPANFDKWDAPKGDTPPASLPADFSGWDGDKPKSATPQTPGFFRGLYETTLGGAEGLWKSFNEKPTEGTLFDQQIGSQVEEGNKAVSSAKQGRYSEMVGHGIAAALPILGPSAAKAGEDIGAGKTAYGLGEATGLVGQVVAPELARRGLSTVGKLRESAQGFARKVTGVEPAVKDAVTKAAEQHEGAVTANEAQKQAGVERAGQAKSVDEHSVKVREHLEKVEGAVAKEANAKFDRVREKIGNPEAPAGPLVETVKGVEANVLQNIPENIKEFRAILKLEPLPEHIADAVRAHVGFEPEGTEPLTWDKLQSLKSRLDARLRSRSAMNGDLKRALYQTRDAVVDEMGKMADANGAQGEWQDARDFWRKYKEDFHEASGPSGSASPVAQSLNAIDPANIRQPFLRTQSAISNRGTEILRRWPQHGGTEAATAVENMVSEHGKLKYMPDKNPNPPAPTPPTVDISKVAKGAIAQRAKSWVAFNARDVGIIASSAIAEPIAKLLGLGGGGGSVLPVAVGAYEGGKFAAARVLNNPAVIEWLAKTPPEEAAALQKIPGADKIRIVDGLTKAAIQSGKPVPLSAAARTLLGPANVARIVAATAAGSQVKNRRDALERLGKTPGEKTARFNPPSKVKGMKTPGNINLGGRPILHNSDGTVSSERSFSIGTDQGEVLIPRVFDGKDHTEQEAIEHYRRTGQHMGIFETPEDADAYAEQVHNRNIKSPN